MNVEGLPLAQRSDVPTRITSRARPETITGRDARGTLTGWTVLGRWEQLLSWFVYKSGNCLTPRAEQGAIETTIARLVNDPWRERWNLGAALW
jgi:hypothetical protein